MTEWLRMPAIAATHGQQIDNLIGWTHIFMLLLFVGWGGFIAYVLFRFRKSRNPVANYTGVKSHVSSYLEAGVLVVELVLLFAFSIPLWAARVDHVPPESEALVVHLTGEQFAWNVRYAGPDGKFGKTDIKLIDVQENPLGIDRNDPAAEGRRHDAQPDVPACEPANHREAPEQGRHSQLRRARIPREQDAIPGLTIPVWFIPHVTTAEMRAKKGNPEFQYEIACAQLCGLGHYRMRGFVTVQTAEEFQKWMDERVAELASPDPFK